MRYRYLSHIIQSGMPVYGGRAPRIASSIRAISRKDSANVSSISLINHWGTHIDLPRHFFDGGPSVCDYPARCWVFRAPCVIPVHLKPSELLRCAGWHKSIRTKHDMILFRSMWSRRRSEKEYGVSNPGIHPEVAIFLRNTFPNVRAIGIDWVSVSPYKDRMIGRLSHRAFLDPAKKGRPIAIVEDMDLSGSMEGLEEVVALPLRIEKIDSAPATILGVFGD